MIIDGATFETIFAVLSALGAVILGIANIALLKPPVSVTVTPRAPKTTMRIITRRVLWSR
ncbi:hypothetical protein [Nitrospira sp. Nam74]